MFVKHIGKHGDRKVAVVFRKVPNEDHMALVCYTETLKTEMQDALMRAVESEPGQQALDLGEALQRAMSPDGRPILEVLHVEGKIKKVSCNQVIMTPSPNNTVRLDELNTILDQLEQGGEAVQKLAEIDQNSGLVDPSAQRRAQEIVGAANNTLNPNDGLSDEALAENFESQAAKMEAEAKGLLEEAKRLKGEAKALKPKRTTTRKKKTADVSQ